MIDYIVLGMFRFDLEVGDDTAGIFIVLCDLHLKFKFADGENGQVKTGQHCRLGKTKHDSDPEKQVHELKTPFCKSDDTIPPVITVLYCNLQFNPSVLQPRSRRIRMYTVIYQLYPVENYCQALCLITDFNSEYHLTPPPPAPSSQETSIPAGCCRQSPGGCRTCGRCSGQPCLSASPVLPISFP